MATINSFVRAANASYKRSARIHEKNVRAAAKQQKENLKQLIISENVNAVESYEKFIKTLLSVHQECGEQLNWSFIRKEPKPTEPVNHNKNQVKAEITYKAFKPTFFDKIFKNDKKKLQVLLSNIELAKKADYDYHQIKLMEYNTDLKDWKKVQSIADGISKNDPLAFKNAITFFDPFSNISDLGFRLQVNCFTDVVTVDLHVSSEDIIPNFILSHTSTGKLSNKKMPISKFNELYQDYVCGCVLRVARELFALLPINTVQVSAKANMLNTSTGHKEDQTILSVSYDLAGLKRLNFKTLDCSDSLANFPHIMKFSKTNGFSPIDQNHKNLRSN